MTETRPRRPGAGRNAMEREMKSLNILTLILVIVGGLNWGLVGAFGFDLVAAIFGPGSALARLVYILVGLSAIWQLGTLAAVMRGEAPTAQRR
jgi:uncharacterized membrane protein YuzA (DUF378 family)